MAKDLEDRLNEGTLDLAAIEPPPGKEPPAPAFKRFADVAEGALARFERRARGEEKPVPLPFPELAKVLGGGLWPGFHCFVAGTGKGKTQLALQIALHAAREGTPALYVGLEMGELDWVARLIGAQSKSAWSKLFLGQFDPAAEMSRYQMHAESLAKLPLYLIEGPPQGWAYTNIGTAAQELRKLHPQGKGPALLVLDFLQIVGKAQEREEIRERVGSAAYRCREIARNLDFAVLALSSTARDNYSTLNTSNGLEIEDGGGRSRGIAHNVDSLIGLGKESGEVEYSADSVLVAMSLPPPAQSLIIGERRGSTKGVAIVAAKVRAGRPGWAPFEFNGHNFTEHPFPDMEEWRASLARTDEETQAAKLATKSNRPRGSQRRKSTAPKSKANGNAGDAPRAPWST